MIILGIDPGTLITGYGVIRCEGSLLEALDYGCIRPPAHEALAQRYCVLFDGVELLLERYRPSAVAVESQFVLRNAQSAIKLGMAKGMALLAAARRGIPVCEYSPMQAKLSVAGTGAASKQQVQGMIRSLLRLPAPPEPPDAADALALAICHSHHHHNRSYWKPCTTSSKAFLNKKHRSRQSLKQPGSATASQSP